MRIKWTRRALANLNAELTHIAQDDPDAARLVAARIEEAVARLEQQPPWAAPAGCREPESSLWPAPTTSPYRMKGRQLELLRVFHRPPLAGPALTFSV